MEPDGEALLLPAAVPGPLLEAVGEGLPQDGGAPGREPGPAGSRAGSQAGDQRRLAAHGHDALVDGRGGQQVPDLEAASDPRLNAPPSANVA